jgi:hypothetical protein
LRLYGGLARRMGRTMSDENMVAKQMTIAATVGRTTGSSRSLGEGTARGGRPGVEFVEKVVWAVVRCVQRIVC